MLAGLLHISTLWARMVEDGRVRDELNVETTNKKRKIYY